MKATLTEKLSLGDLQRPLECSICQMMTAKKRNLSAIGARPRWLHIEEALGELPGRTLPAKQVRYREHFAEMIGAGDFGTGWKETLATELVLGSEDFVKRVRCLIKGDRTEQKPLRQLECADRLAGHNPGRSKGLERALGEGQPAPWRSGARGSDAHRSALCRNEFAANRRSHWGPQLSGGQRRGTADDRALRKGSTAAKATQTGASLLESLDTTPSVNLSSSTTKTVASKAWHIY
jgi:hypothetical protein